MKFVFRIISISALSVVLIIAGISCNQSPVGSREGSQRVAEEFTKKETTFRFDGIPKTFKVTSTKTRIDAPRE